MIKVIRWIGKVIATANVVWLAWTLRSMARKRKQAELNAEILRRIEEGNDGTWELTPSMTLTIETIVIEASPAKESNDD